MYNIPFSLGFEDRENIIFIFHQYMRFTDKRFSYKNLLPCIFDQLGINFCIKPAYNDVFNEFLDFLLQEINRKNLELRITEFKTFNTKETALIEFREV